ncbi:MAG TPA: YncE family protein, partial [Acidobacteriaceae bacterium]
MRLKSQLTSSFIAFVFFSASLLFAARSFAAEGTYSIVDHWKIGGEGSWDYLVADPSMHVLYITHGTQVEVVDTTTGKKIGAITGFKGTHGIALDPDGKVGFISGGAGNEVVAFDRKTYARITSIPAGQNPDG